MKLNIGCGYNRLEGWTNIDINPDSAADRVMPAHSLDFPDGSVSEIKALQLIEHLGFFKAKYFLAECWRVLEPGGGLLLETPDIEKTFSLFLDGDHAVKEAALGWVYGSETPGMNHLYCFPAGLLSALLEEAGFEITGKEEFFYQPSRPALRFKAVKKPGEKAALNAALRRRLVGKGLAGLEDELEGAGTDFVIKRLVASGGNKTIALEAALYSASVVLECFSMEEENERHPSAQASACARLSDAGVQALLMAELEKAAGAGEVTSELFNGVFEGGKKMIASALDGAPVAPAAAHQAAPRLFTLRLAQAFIAKKRTQPGK
ncbi:MAG TPA: hypothetical protein DCZ92_09895 [Elusimicrobia bacterium]|nr:MAG: hypothetical protein A2016_05290 [Elusimicrobia bacterium GWF2_62_30]HBA61112.1 hypothetical protein [Elusimicrobiota bacterium]